MLVHIKDIVKDAQKKGYAVGAFNVHGIESVLGIVQAAKRAQAPTIIQVSEGTISYMGVKPITHLVTTAAKNIAANVPIALHLDHGKSLNAALECIDAGFSSVHIDASELPLDENIKISKEVVKIAHAKKVWVQGEIGSIVGGHGKVGGFVKGIQLADPEEVEEFVKATKVDAIAAAIGTAHGAFKNEDVKFDILRAIMKKIGKTPLVMHGGSGIEDKKVRKAIKEGVAIINIGTDIKVAFCHTLIGVCAKNKKETDPRNLLKPTIKAIEDVAYAKMKLFGSAGRA